MDQATLGPSAVGGQVVTKKYIPYNVSGNLTAVTAAPVLLVTEAGRIASVDVAVETYPTSTDRTITITPKKVNGATTTTLSSTAALFSFAGSGSGQFSTITGGTGITACVLKTDGSANVVPGDQVTLDVALAGSNGTLGTGLSVLVTFIPAAVLPTS